MSHTALAAPIPPRMVRTRRIALTYPDGGGLPRHYMSGDLVMSHVVTNLSAMFPEGEDFFVRSVRHYRDRISDPELKKRVAGFIGQEAMHGREHRTFNERLGELGYPTRLVDRSVKRVLGLGERVLPKSVQLAITAALEHYTATLAEVLLTDPEVREMMGVDEVRSLFLWHALEESEHKSVAYDVASTVASLATDPATYRHPVRLVKGLVALRHSPFLRRQVLAHLWSYNGRKFHPEDRDTAGLIDQWRDELFGDQGSLIALVRSSESEKPLDAG
jgi:predicted metal-dependent hydrolase